MAARSANVILEGNNGGGVSLRKGVMGPLYFFLSDHSWRSEVKGKCRGHHLYVKSYHILSHGYLRSKGGVYLRAHILFVPKYNMSCPGI